MSGASTPPQDGARRYHAYGLGVSSTLALPELARAPLAQPVDITIVEAPLSNEPPRGVVVHRAGVWIGPSDLQFETTGVARYRVQNGTHITIDRAPGADDDSVRLFLLGTCLVRR